MMGIGGLHFCAGCACGYEWQPGWGHLCGGCHRAEAAEAERDRLGDDVAEQALRIIDLERQSNELYTALEDLAQEAFSGDDRRAARRALEEARRIPTGDGGQEA